MLSKAFLLIVLNLTVLLFALIRNYSNLKVESVNSELCVIRYLNTHLNCYFALRNCELQLTVPQQYFALLCHAFSITGRKALACDSSWTQLVRFSSAAVDVAFWRHSKPFFAFLLISITYGLFC